MVEGDWCLGQGSSLVGWGDTLLAQAESGIGAGVRLVGGSSVVEKGNTDLFQVVPGKCLQVSAQ